MDNRELTPEQIRRYTRQLMLPEISDTGQQRLLAGSVFIVGCGALGSNIAPLLAGAGVGRIGIADHDTIDVSNLHRQVHYGTDQQGEKKLAMLAKVLRKINPEIRIDEMDIIVDEGNAEEIFSDYDFIIDGSDNPSTKYLVNDVCTKLGKPFCIGGVSGWKGQLLTVCPGTMTYRDLFGDPAEDKKETPLPVMGAAPAIVGALQATEAIKYLTGAGELNVNGMLTFDLLQPAGKFVSLGF